MFIRKIGKVLRGNATPAQIMLACVLGSVLGFMPGFAQAGGLILLGVVLLVVLNANLTLSVLAGLLSKLLSLVLLPVSFGVGRFLLDGPTGGFFAWAINTPVLALFGFEYYVTSGGLVIGVLVGAVLGAVVIRSLRQFRTKMAALEAGSPAYAKWSRKKMVRCLTWLLVGGSAKESYTDLLEKRGKLIRPLGLVLVAGMVVLVVIANQFFADALVTGALRGGLERANGATVDLEGASLDLGAGRLEVNGLAMADPNALEKNLLSALKLEADISSTDMLRKRLRLDRVVVSQAVYGEKRGVPGYIVGDRPEPEEAETEEGDKTIEDYMADAEAWKNRLAQVKRWLEKMSGPEDEAGAEGETEGVGRETLAERLARQARELGYANVAAEHLIADAPTLVIGELVIEGLRVVGAEGVIAEGVTLDVVGKLLSTHPRLVEGVPTVSVVSSDGALGLELVLPGTAGKAGLNTLDFGLKGVDGDLLGEQLAVGETRPISGGTVDVSLKGSFDPTGATHLDLPLEVVLRNATLSIPGAGEAPVELFRLPIGLRGPIDNPKVTIDDKLLKDALVEAGASALAGRLKGEAGEALEKATGDLKEKIGDRLGKEAGDQLGGAAKGVLDGLFGGKKD